MLEPLKAMLTTKNIRSPCLHKQITSLATLELFSFMKSHLSNRVYGVQKVLPYAYNLPMFSSSSLRGFQFQLEIFDPFWSHFLVQGNRHRPDSILMHVVIRFPHHHAFRCFEHLCQASDHCSCAYSGWGCFVLFCLTYMPVCMPTLYCLYYSPIIHLETQNS